MRFVIHRSAVQVTPTLEKGIAQKVKKVETRLKRYHPDAADLELQIKYVKKQDVFACVLQLKAFKESLHAEKSAPELRVAVDKTFDALMRELEHYRVKINKSLQS